jgi:UPF0042 nucleotide-binding protein
VPRIIIISGSSGAGKSTALRLLEDEGYYCVDNLPPRLLTSFIDEVLESPFHDRFHGIVACIDARAFKMDLRDRQSALNALIEIPDHLIIFLDAQPHALLKRFNETRRRHPLADHDSSLTEAIAREREYLEEIAAEADLLIDTTDLTPRALRDTITTRIVEQRDGLSVMIESFAFKRGVPTDADFVFDARAIPNPYWHETLRPLTGQDTLVKEFLDNEERCVALFDRLREFISGVVTDFNQCDRSYMTIAIGCTGGQHRSVYLADKIHADLQKMFPHALIRHRDLKAAQNP